MRAAERAAWRAVALGGEGAAGEVRLPQADGSNGAEEKRKRRQKRLSFSLELIEHYGKKSLFCKRPPNPFYAGPGTQLEPSTSARVKPSGDFFLFLAALNPVRAGLPRWPMRWHTTLVPRISFLDSTAQTIANTSVPAPKQNVTRGPELRVHARKLVHEPRKLVRLDECTIL